MIKIGRTLFLRITGDWLIVHWIDPEYWFNVQGETLPHPGADNKQWLCLANVAQPDRKKLGDYQEHGTVLVFLL